MRQDARPERTTHILRFHAAIPVVVAMFGTIGAIPAAFAQGLEGPLAGAMPTESTSYPPRTLTLTNPGLAISKPELQPVAPPVANHRSTLMLGGLYLSVSLSALILFPPDNWNGNFTPRPAQMARSWTRAPTWHDGDPWTTNFVGHPIMGSVLYVFARRNHHTPLQAFLFSSVASTTWEYAFEGWYEQPSWSDLLVTSTAGALIGEGRWQIRKRLLRNGTPGFLGQVALFLVDPITEIDILFGF
jgi:hypothetical protein